MQRLSLVEAEFPSGLGDRSRRPFTRWAILERSRRAVRSHDPTLQGTCHDDSAPISPFYISGGPRMAYRCSTDGRNCNGDAATSTGPATTSAVDKIPLVAVDIR